MVSTADILNANAVGDGVVDVTMSSWDLSLSANERKKILW